MADEQMMTENYTPEKSGMMAQLQQLLLCSVANSD